MTEQHGNRSIPPGADRGPPRPGRLFELLTDSRRRRLLYRLRKERSSQLTTVAHEIARQEAVAAGTVPPDRVRAVYLDLYHTHVPKLDEAGIVDYSEALGEVVLVHTDEAFTRCLDAAAGLEEV